LARHRIGHQEHFLRFHGGSHSHQLPHQLIVNVETPAGVQYDEIAPLVPPPFHTSLADADDIGLDSLCLIGAIYIDAKISS
jgi:hypothetical protein